MCVSVCVCVLRVEGGLVMKLGDLGNLWEPIKTFDFLRVRGHQGFCLKGLEVQDLLGGRGA